MARILILFAHPAFEKSRVHKALVKQALQVEGVTFSDLYELYPDHDIDVDREQAVLLQHDIIIMQHPFYWYSSPAILKQWQDLVLEHGWAYGRGGTRLAGKYMMNAITAGGREDVYQETGHNRFTVRQLLSPFDQTAHLCKMHYLPPFVVHDTHRMTPETIQQYAKQYHDLLTALRDDRLDLPAVLSGRYINEHISSPRVLNN
ncbi:MAG: NAD(P)H oxidoreductase [Chitinophagaceae bacterium]|nr:MAG: NAD(P)H oxidoreductase [Chitinophagaceae bacterium]